MLHERARPAHDAPEIDIHQPRHLRLVEFIELSQQRNPGIVDKQAKRREIGNGGRGEILNCFGIGDIHAADRDAACMRSRNFFRHQLKTRLIQIGKRQIATECGEFQRQGTSDAAGRARDRRSRSFKLKTFHMSPWLECETAARPCGRNLDLTRQWGTRVTAL